MLKTILISLIISLSALVLPGAVAAQENCVTVYGEGVVCGAEAPEHKPVEAGIEDLPKIAGAFFLLASGVSFYLSKRVASRKVSGTVYIASDSILE